CSSFPAVERTEAEMRPDRLGHHPVELVIDIDRALRRHALDHRRVTDDALLLVKRADALRIGGAGREERLADELRVLALAADRAAFVERDDAVFAFEEQPRRRLARFPCR